MSRRVRYYEPDGTPVFSEDEELWRRLGATTSVPQDSVPPSGAEESKDKTEEDDRVFVAETFDALTSAKAELQLLHGLINQLESQTTLGVTYIPDTRSADDFHFQMNKEKLIKAEEKRSQMKEAASILMEIHKTLGKQVKKERTFYRELVHVQSKTLSPFVVDLSIKRGWDVELAEEPLLVDLYPDAEGHVSVGEDIAQPAVETVMKTLDTVEECREQVTKELSAIERTSDYLMDEYKKRLESGEMQKRYSDDFRKRSHSFKDPTNKRIRMHDQPSITLKPVLSTETDIREQPSGKEVFANRVISLDLNPEDEELLVSSEEGESESASEEDLMPSVMVNETLREEWFTREELLPITRVHMALCDLQLGNVWKVCKKTLQTQADRINMGPVDRFVFEQAMYDLDLEKPEARFVKTDLLSRFVQCVYRLPPFLHQIDIRDIGLKFRESLLLLTKPSSNARQGQTEDMDTAEKESRMPLMHEEDEEWLTKLRPIQFFKYRFRETSPRLGTLLSTFMRSLCHQHLLYNVIWPALENFPDIDIHVGRTPGIASSLIELRIPGSFEGEILVDSTTIHLHGCFVRERGRRRLPWMLVERDQFERALAILGD